MILTWEGVSAARADLQPTRSAKVVANATKENGIEGSLPCCALLTAIPT